MQTHRGNCLYDVRIIADDFDDSVLHLDKIRVGRALGDAGVAYPAQGFQAHPPLRRAGSGGESREVGAGASSTVGSGTRPRGVGIVGGVRVPYRPTRVGTLSALRPRVLCADGTDSGIEGATTPAARTTVTSLRSLTSMGKRGALGRQGSVRPLQRRAYADTIILDRFRSRKKTSARQTVRSTSPLCYIRHAIRLTRRRAALQSP